MRQPNCQIFLFSVITLASSMYFIRHSISSTFLMTNVQGLLKSSYFSKFLTSNSLRSLQQAMSTHYATVSYVTTPNEESARQLSKKLIEKRLAACVNILKGVESVYEWKGKLEQDNEVLLVIKSSSAKSQELANFVVENHPYDCPEVVTLRVDSGSERYLRWVEETVNKEPLNEGI